MIQIAAIFRHRVEHSKNIYSYFSFLIRCSEVDTALLSRPCPNSNSKRRLLRNNLLIQRLSNEINRSWHFTTAIWLLENRIALDLLSGVQIAVVSYVFAVADWLLTKATSDGRSVLLSTKRKIKWTLSIHFFSLLSQKKFLERGSIFFWLVNWLKLPVIPFE